MEQGKGKGLQIGAIVLGVLGVVAVVLMRKVLFGGVFMLAGAGLYIRHMAAGLPPGAAPFWQERSVLIAGFFGIVAVLVLSMSVREVGAQYAFKTEVEQDIAKTKQTLENAKYDAKGNVVGNSTEFYMAVGSSKVLPQSLKQANEDLTLSIGLTAGALAVLGVCAFVIVRASKRARPAPAG